MSEAVWYEIFFTIEFKTDILYKLKIQFIEEKTNSEKVHSWRYEYFKGIDFRGVIIRMLQTFFLSKNGIKILIISRYISLLNFKQIWTYNWIFA